MKEHFLSVLLIVFFVFVLCLACTITVSADTSGNYTYTVIDGEAEITDFNTSVSGSINIPSTLGGYPVTSIGYGAFRDCKDLTSISIPNSITSISYYSFYGCTALKSITIPDSVNKIGTDILTGTAYYEDVNNWENGLLYCGNHLIRAKTNITSCNINLNTITIANRAFENCRNLLSVTMPIGIKSIGNYVFYNCSSIESITIPEGITCIEEHSFYGCESLVNISIPYSITSIGFSAFKKCTSLTSITIPEGITSIGDYAFEGCSSLTSITIPEGVTSIGDYAFEGCSSLANITIPDSITSIGRNVLVGTKYFEDLNNWENSLLYCGNYLIAADRSITSCKIKPSTKIISSSAFESCNNLTRITLPKSIVHINGYTFYNCSSLTSIDIPEGITDIGMYAFYNCSSLTSIDIPESITSIGMYAFYNCSSLTSIVIPNGVTSIGSSVFQGCSSLIDITIPNNVTIIGWSAFEDCTSLTSITIPEGTKIIRNRAFKNCSKLTNVTIPKSITDIGAGAFEGCNSLEEITLPFIGSKREQTGTFDSVFGWIFGYSFSYDTGTTYQEYKLNSDLEFYYYIPQNLKKITITDEIVIPCGAFHNCKSLRSITILGDVKCIENYAFRNCNKLTISGFKGSVTEIYANENNIPFVALSFEDGGDTPEGDGGDTPDDEGGSEVTTAPYTINSLRVLRLSDGASLDTIHTGDFVAEVSITNVSAETTDTIVLAAYDADGVLQSLTYMYMTIDVGKTASMGTLFHNSDGKISTIKALVWTSLSGLKPLAGSSVFPK